MNLVGRERELDQLAYLCSLDRPQFVAVYGRRRVGKTRLVRDYFNNEFAFYATGVAGGAMADQLRAFGLALQRYGAPDANPRDWFDAFAILVGLLEGGAVNRDLVSGKLVVFIDELPWLDTPRSGFLAALEWFWNSWGSARNDVFLVVCGSASSWIVKKLFKNRGGLHNRVTGRIRLEPLTLGDCEKLLAANGMPWSREQVMEAYMTFGGIPFYLELLDRRASLAQNIDILCFSSFGQLRQEFDELFRSLFKNAELHIKIVRASAARGCGLTREQIVARTGIPSGSGLTTAIQELEQCGFLRGYHAYGKKKKEMLYQLIDPFTLFWLRFVEESTDEMFWQHNLQSARLRSWRGYAFELVCLLHVEQVKGAVGIAAIASDVSSWRGKDEGGSTQVDLVIDRADGIIDLCEMKWSSGEFAITKAYDRQLRSRREAFVSQTCTRKSARIVLVTPNGVKQNAYRWSAEAVITAEDLFA